MDIQEEIFKSIESLSKNSSSTRSDYSTVILGAMGGSKYKVKIDGAERTAKDTIGLDLKVGDAVWCHAMNGNIGQLYIMCRR